MPDASIVYGVVYTRTPYCTTTTRNTHNELVQELDICAKQLDYYITKKMENEESPATSEKLIVLLTEKGVHFVLTKDHKPCRTSEESAQVRGVSLDSGAKALLICGKKKSARDGDVSFYLAVMSASNRFASKQFKRIIGCKSIRFATDDEVMEITDCLPGAVPPFGSIFGIPLWVDRSLSRQESINFNCGLRTASISMTYADYVSVEQPNTDVFTEEEIELGEIPNSEKK